MKTTTREKKNPLEKDLYPEIQAFENFLKIIGFKRTDGAIFGLLVLSPRPLSSEEIGKALSLSQGAVSQGLKNLTHWGAVESKYSPEHRAQLHSAPQSSLSVVTTVFEKREKLAIDAFRVANETAKNRFLAEGDSPDSERMERLTSNMTTCDFAQVIMDFAIALNRIGMPPSRYTKTIRVLPKVLNSLLDSGVVVGKIKDQFISRLKESSLWG